MTDLNTFINSKKSGYIEENKEPENLMVVHNIQEQNLIKTISDYNGLLAPSLAIIGDNDNYTKFGEITLLFDPKSIFNNNASVPKQESIHLVYSSDMYSVRFPSLEHDFKKSFNSFPLYKSLLNFNDVSTSYINDFEYKVKNSLIDTINYFRQLDSFKLHFLTSTIDDFSFKPAIERKEVFDPIIKDDIFKNYLKSKNFRDTYNEKELAEQLLSSKDRTIENLNSINNPSLIRRAKIRTNVLFNKYIADNGEINKDGLSHLVSLSNEFKNPSFTIDRFKNSKKIDRIIHKNKLEKDFEDFVSTTASQFFINPHLKYKSKKLGYTEQNILSVMKKQRETGSEETMSFSLSKAKACSSIQFFSLNEVYDNKSSLVTEKRFEEEKENTSNIFDIYTSHMRRLNPDADTFNLLDSASEILGKNVYFSSKASFDSILKKHYLHPSDDDLINSFNNASTSLRNNNVTYFEAKPFRKIESNEIKVAIVPRNISPETKTILRENNIKMAFYNSNDPDHRLTVLKKQKKYLLNKTYLNNLKKTPTPLKHKY